MTAPLDHAADFERGPRGRFDSALRDEVLRGLRAPRKSLPPKLFYDDTGASLFERICTLPEYYPTRTELGILESCVGELASLAGPGCALIEYGSGAGTKVRLLLDALDNPAAYVPIDIAAEQLARVAGEVAAEYPAVAVRPVLADYTRAFSLPALPPHARRVAFFPGSTIGNFDPAAAADFLGRIRRTVGDSGALILGADRIKDRATLESAYDDAQGVTAAFNLNMLARLNRELGADFDLATFMHRACWDARARRVEMHLVSLRDQVVTVAGDRIPFERGESIWTESSYKFDEASLRELATGAGFAIERLWTDVDDRFWVGFMRAA